MIRSKLSLFEESIVCFALVSNPALTHEVVPVYISAAVFIGVLLMVLLTPIMQGQPFAFTSQAIFHIVSMLAAGLVKMLFQSVVATRSGERPFAPGVVV